MAASQNITIAVDVENDRAKAAFEATERRIKALERALASAKDTSKGLEQAMTDGANKGGGALAKGFEMVKGAIAAAFAIETLRAFFDYAEQRTKALADAQRQRGNTLNQTIGDIGLGADLRGTERVIAGINQISADAPLLTEEDQSRMLRTVFGVRPGTDPENIDRNLQILRETATATQGFSAGAQDFILKRVAEAENRAPSSGAGDIRARIGGAYSLFSALGDDAAGFDSALKMIEQAGTMGPQDRVRAMQIVEGLAAGGISGEQGAKFLQGVIGKAMGSANPMATLEAAASPATTDQQLRQLFGENVGALRVARQNYNPEGFAGSEAVARIMQRNTQVIQGAGYDVAAAQRERSMMEQAERAAALQQQATQMQAGNRVFGATGSNALAGVVADGINLPIVGNVSLLGMANAMRNNTGTGFNAERQSIDINVRVDAPDGLAAQTDVSMGGGGL